MTNEPTPSQPSPDATDSPEALAESSTSPQPLPTAWIERVFERLSALYGSKFADLWRGCDIEGVKSVWAKELAGYSPTRSPRHCRLQDARLAPTLPEFLKVCRPALDYERAFIEAIEQMRKRETGGDEWSTRPCIGLRSRLAAICAPIPTRRSKAAGWLRSTTQSRESAPASFRPTCHSAVKRFPPPASAASRPRWRSSVSRTSATCWPENNHAMTGASYARRNRRSWTSTGFAAGCASSCPADAGDASRMAGAMESAGRQCSGGCCREGGQERWRRS